jgi:hypothetical protein
MKFGQDCLIVRRRESMEELSGHDYSITASAWASIKIGILTPRALEIDQFDLGAQVDREVSPLSILEIFSKALPELRQ